MIIKSTIIAAGLIFLALPEAASAQSWRTNEVYPPKALREGREGTTYFTVQIGTDGKAKNCSVTKSSGSADLDQAACAIAVRRGRWKPATDEQGNAVEGSFSSKFKWELPR